MLLSILLVGCADSGDEGFVVVNNLASSEEECAFTADLTGAFVSRGEIYLDSPRAYTMNPLVQSRISAVMGQESQKTIALRGARVSLDVPAITVTKPGAATTTVTFSDGEIAALESSGAFKFTSLFSASLAPGGLTTASFDGVSVAALEAVRAKVNDPGASIRAQFVVTATLYGDLGGDEVSGVPYVFPVTACNDCIVNIVPDAVNMGAPAACPLPMTTVVRPGNACNAYQDGIVDCCVEMRAEGPVTVCPGPIATM